MLFWRLRKTLSAVAFRATAAGLFIWKTEKALFFISNLWGLAQQLRHSRYNWSPFFMRKGVVVGECWSLTAEASKNTTPHSPVTVLSEGFGTDPTSSLKLNRKIHGIILVGAGLVFKYYASFPVHVSFLAWRYLTCRWRKKTTDKDL